jgi:Protein kinase domain
MSAPNPPDCHVTRAELEEFLQLQDLSSLDTQGTELRQHINHCPICQSQIVEILGSASVIPPIDIKLPSELLACLLNARPKFEASANQLPSELRTDELGPWSDYTIVQEIGRGGMGVVYLARDRRLNRQVALKVLSAQQPSADLRTRFVREGRAMAALADDGIVPIFEVIDDPLSPAIVMPVMEGGSLATRIRSQDYTSRQAAIWVFQIARALTRVHSSGFVHRDVKPANVLLDSANRAKLSDFGLARSRMDFRLTAPAATPGTPEYLPPESLKNDSTYKPTGDIYQCGILLYHLIVGKAPFEGSLAELLNNITTANFRSPRLIRPNLPKDLDRICMKAMALSPEDRYQTAAQLSDDLEKFLDGREIAARPISVFAKTGRWLIRHPRQCAIAASVVLALTGSAAYTLFQAKKIQSLDDAVAQAMEHQKVADDAVARAKGHQKAAEIERDHGLGQILHVAAAANHPNSQQAPSPEALGKLFLKKLGESLDVSLRSSVAKMDSPRVIGTTAMGLAKVRSRSGEYVLTQEAAQAAVEQLKTALQSSPDDSTLQTMLCSARILLVRSCLELSRSDEAKQNLALLRDELQQLNRVSPKAPGNLLDSIEERILVTWLNRNTPDHKSSIEEAQALIQSLRSSNIFPSVDQFRFGELIALLENEIKIASEVK